MFMVDINLPMDGGQAGKLIRQCLSARGAISFSFHALDEMAADNMTEVDAVNVLRGGKIFEPAEFHKWSWRYRVHTTRFCVVVAFRSEFEIRVVTGWRKKR